MGVEVVGAGREAFLPDGRRSLPPEHNVEMRWEDVDPDAYLTPNKQFFVRSHSATPDIDPASWTLRIDGDAVARPFGIGYQELLSMPAVTVTRALECAGNGRALFAETHARVPPGEGWELGAIGVAAWTGVPLAQVLDRAGVAANAREVVPEGLDELRVRRPLPIERAGQEDVL